MQVPAERCYVLLPHDVARAGHGRVGAIGSFIVRRLVSEGQQVVVFSRHENYTLLPDLTAGITFAGGDVQDRAVLESAVRDHGVRRIIHLAAALGGTLERNPQEGYG